MNRWIVTTVALLAIALFATAPACGSTGVGDPCIPDAEYSTTFTGFDIGEVSTESDSFTCLTRLCLVNHFQGRVTCPYGQNDAGVGKPGSYPSSVYGPDAGAQYDNGCIVPGTFGTDKTITGGSNRIQGNVNPQCAGVGAENRTAQNTVYCSCRCSNAQQQTNDGANYCSCPSGYSCQLLVTSGITAPNSDAGIDQELTGGYCVKDGTVYSSAANGCTIGACDPSITSPSLPGYCPPPDTTF